MLKVKVSKCPFQTCSKGERTYRKSQETEPDGRAQVAHEG
jgi:hypothetical protein